MLPSKKVITLSCLVLKNFEGRESLIYICLIVCLANKRGTTAKINFYYDYVFLKLNSNHAKLGKFKELT